MSNYDITRQFSRTLIDLIQHQQRQQYFMPIALGGATGSGGGVGSPPGGFTGQLAQKWVAFDTTEASSSGSVGGSGSVASLVDNLNRIRYDIRHIQSTWLPDSGVVSGSYTAANIVVDQYGRITTATSGTGGGWQLTGNAGTSGSINFIGTTDDVEFAVRTNNIDRAHVKMPFSAVGYRTKPYNVSINIGGESSNIITDSTANGYLHGMWYSPDLGLTYYGFAIAHNYYFGTTGTLLRKDTAASAEAIAMQQQFGAARILFYTTTPAGTTYTPLRISDNTVYLSASPYIGSYTLGIGGNVAIDSAFHADATGVADGNILSYDLATTTWKPTSIGGISGVTTTGTPATNQVAVFSSGSSITGSANLTYVPGDGSMFLGVVSPETAGITDSLNVVADDDHATGYYAWGLGQYANPYLVFCYSRGSASSPSAVLTDDVIGYVDTTPYAGGAMGWGWGRGGSIKFAAGQDFTATKIGTRIEFWGTPNDSATKQILSTLQHDGTSSQQLIKYNSTNYCMTQVFSSGSVVMSAFGSGSGFAIRNMVNIACDTTPQLTLTNPTGPASLTVSVAATTGITTLTSTGTTPYIYTAQTVAIGAVPTLASGTLLEAYNSVNSGVKITARNDNAGTGAFSELTANNRGSGLTTGAIRMIAFGTGYTTSGAFIADSGMLLADNAMTAGLSLCARRSTGVMRFYTGGITDANLAMYINPSQLIGFGTSSPSVKGHVVYSTAVANNNVVLDTFRIEARVNDTDVATTGFGPGLSFYGESDTNGNYRQMGLLAVVWSDATDATRTSYMPISLVNNASAITEVARFNPTNLLMASTNLIHWRDTAIGAYSQADTYLDIFADGAVRIGNSSAGAPTTYLSIEPDADTFWTGSGSGLPYGSCYGNEIAWTQANAAQNTWYLISDADMNDGQLNLVTHDGSGKLTVSKAGKYVAVWDASVEISIAGKHVQIGLSVNGAAPVELNHFDLNLAGSEIPIGGNAILSLAANDTVEAAIRTTDAGTPDLAIDHLMISLVQVGG